VAVSLPVSGSAPGIAELGRKAGHLALALTEAAAVIGPPINDFFAANSFSDSGGKSPTLLEAGLARPSSPVASVYRLQLPVNAQFRNWA
jgi:hypothetical protein